MIFQRTLSIWSHFLIAILLSYILYIIVIIVYLWCRHGAEIVDPMRNPNSAGGPSTSRFGGRGYRLGQTPDDIEGKSCSCSRRLSFERNIPSFTQLFL